jgi:cbb3-type cytochrome oxidase maturation protein
MTALLILIPVALFLGGVGLIAFLWSLRSGQFEDLDGAAVRILADDVKVSLPSPLDRKVTTRIAVRPTNPRFG